MTVSEFRRQLAAKGSGPGARWVKADFHIHLPTSNDYRYRGQDAVARLGAALEATGLGFAVVLKHEAFATKAELGQLQPYCPSVTLIPGAEVNIIVDALSGKIGKDYFFHCIVAGDPTDPDEYGHILRAARNELQYREDAHPSGFRSSIVDVALHLRKSGALFIPAHLHQSKPPEVSRSIDDLYDDDAFLGFVDAGAFDALEVREGKTASFFDGNQKTPHGLSIPRISCVRSSDAHQHEAVGSRVTWVRSERRTFGELKAALALPPRVTLDQPDPSHAQVVGLHVVGAFLSDTWLALNQGLNALIGGKGAGKTALLECLRFVLNTPVPAERADEVLKHRQHILGSGGYVECLVRDARGKHRVIVRRADASERITITEEDGGSTTVMAASGQVFPISILGWHEIESVADRAAARISILDRAGEPESVVQAYARIQEQVAQARDTLPLFQRQVRRLDTALKELWDLRRKRSTLSRLVEGQEAQLQDQYDWFLKAEGRLEGIISAVSVRRTQLPEVVRSRIEPGLPPPMPGGGVADLGQALARVEAQASEAVRAEGASISALDAALARLGSEASEAAASVAAAFRAFREVTYVPAVAALSSDEREVLTKQIQVLEDTKRLPSVESACAEQLRELRALAEQLRLSCVAVCTQRDEIAESRAKLVATLNAKLPGVKLEFQRAANREARDRFKGSYPADGPSLIAFLEGYAGRDAYEKLADLFMRLQSLDIEEGRWTVEAHLSDAKFVDLLDVIDDDDVRIMLEVGKRGFVEIQSLSAGQRCVAVFPLLLRNTRGPLVVDQPEDNLDNRYIADTIGPDLLNQKRSQQFLVTSHNANLVVLTDADLIVHVDSDGTHGGIVAAGFLAWQESVIKEAVLGVLDGGEAALVARQRKYGIRGI
jgi:hypothetical protein